MPEGTSISSEDSGQAVLRWSEAPNCSSREEFVELIEARRFEAIIRSNRKVRVNTLVYLTGKHYASTGIVRSCRKDGHSFLLKIGTDEDITVRFSDLDPGVLTIDDFLTEEQEAQILKDLEEENSRNTVFSVLRSA